MLIISVFVYLSVFSLGKIGKKMTIKTLGLVSGFGIF